MSILKSKEKSKVRTNIPIEEAAPLEPLARINFNVPESKRNLWKSKASLLGLSLGDFITQAIEEKWGK